MKAKGGLTITATELKQNFGKYMSHVEQQGEVIITKNGTKTARLTPYITNIEQYFLVKEQALDYQYGGKKVSYGEFMEIYEKSDLRLEYINGEIVLLASPSFSHQEIVGRLYLVFHEYLRGHECRVVMAPFDVHFQKRDFDEPDVMQPDLLVICDLKGNVTDKGRYLGTPTLVVEILSDSTRSKDMIDKLRTYMLSGVKEYWIVDPRQNVVVIYRLENFEIASYKTYELGSLATSQSFEGLEFEVTGLFADLG